MVELRTDLLKALHGPGDGPWLGSSVTRCDTLCDEALALVESVRARRELAVQKRQAERLIRLLAPVGTRRAPRPEPPLVARARRALDESHRTSLSLDELAGRLRCAPSYLCRVFSQHTGVGPHAYQLQQRLLEARRLVESGWTVATVAALTGFGDESLLRRHFRRRFAVPPGRYQRELAMLDASDARTP
jgi:AraC-like DNA-binding protein